MGCALGKCCGCHLKSSDADSGEFHGVGTSERLTESILVPSHNFRLDFSVLTIPTRSIRRTRTVIASKLGCMATRVFISLAFSTGIAYSVPSVRALSRKGWLRSWVVTPHWCMIPRVPFCAAFQATNQELRNNRVLAEDFSYDQTPFRRDEYERVKLYGARVLNVDQVEGLKDPDILTWGDEETEGNDPPWLWVQDGMYPNTAFTRSIGNSTAERIGVPTLRFLRFTLQPISYSLSSQALAFSNFSQIKL